MARDCEHLCVPARIAEGRVRVFANHVTNGCGLTRAGRYPHQTIRDDTVLDLHCGRQDSVFRNPAMLHASAYHPFVRRRHSPNITTQLAQSAHQFSHFGKYPRNEVVLEELISSLLHLSLGQPAMHGYHFAAHVVLDDLVCSIVGVTGPRPAYNLFGEDTSLQFPIEEPFTRVARPQRAVAIEDCKAGLEAENILDEDRGFGRYGWGQVVYLKRELLATKPNSPAACPHSA